MTDDPVFVRPGIDVVAEVAAARREIEWACDAAKDCPPDQLVDVTAHLKRAADACYSRLKTLQREMMLELGLGKGDAVGASTGDRWIVAARVQSEVTDPAAWEAWCKERGFQPYRVTSKPDPDAVKAAQTGLLVDGEKPGGLDVFDGDPYLTWKKRT